MHNFTQIPGFEEYLLDENGRVYSTKVNRLLKSQRNQRGYAFIRLHTNGRQHTLLVHRLLAFVFLDLPSLDSDLEVDHKDTNIFNNSLDNLQVLSRSDHLDKTHGEWRKTQIRYCSCGSKLSEYNTSGKCRPCYDKYRVSDGITADSILYWVQNFSWTRASIELGLSDNGLRKRYKKLTGRDPKTIIKNIS